MSFFSRLFKKKTKEETVETAVTPPPASPVEAPPAGGDLSLDQMLSAIREIEALVGGDSQETEARPGQQRGELTSLEFTIGQMADLWPEAFDSDQLNPDVRREKTEVLVENLYAQLAAGKVSTTGELFFAGVHRQYLKPNIQAQFKQNIELPLPMVIGMIHPAEFNKRMQGEVHKAPDRTMPDIFGASTSAPGTPAAPAKPPVPPAPAPAPAEKAPPKWHAPVVAGQPAGAPAKPAAPAVAAPKPSAPPPAEKTAAHKPVEAPSFAAKGVPAPGSQAPIIKLSVKTIRGLIQPVMGDGGWSTTVDVERMCNVAVPQLYEQLAAGVIKVAISQLLAGLPLGTYEIGAKGKVNEEVSLPLSLIVPQIDPQEMAKRMTGRERAVSAQPLPDVFSTGLPPAAPAAPKPAEPAKPAPAAAPAPKVVPPEKSAPAFKFKIPAKPGEPAPAPAAPPEPLLKVEAKPGLKMEDTAEPKLQAAATEPVFKPKVAPKPEAQPEPRPAPASAAPAQPQLPATLQEMAEKLGVVLGKAPNYGEVASRFKTLAGFDGCVIVHRDGDLLATSWKNDASDMLEVVAPQIVKKMEHYLQHACNDKLQAVSAYWKNLVLIFVENGAICFIAAQQPGAFSLAHVRAAVLAAEALGSWQGRG